MNWLKDILNDDVYSAFYSALREHQINLKDAINEALRLWVLEKRYEQRYKQENSERV